jgi:amino acid permease
LLEVLQRAWLSLGFIVFVLSWSWLGKRDPDQDKVTRALTAVVITGAVVGIFIIITENLR